VDETGDTVTVSGFVKTFQPVPESQLALLQRKSVCLFFWVSFTIFFYRLQTPCQAFDLLHQTQSMQMV
jgi:hypothetical protein